MKAIPRQVSGQAQAMIGLLLLFVLELAALITAPPHDRAFVAGALVAAGSAVLVVVAAVAHARRDRHRPPAQIDQRVDESWFTADALEGFPMEAVRPWLLRPDAPSLNRLYLAWIMAEQGHDPAWITRHLDLPEPLVRRLFDAARAHR